LTWVFVPVNSLKFGEAAEDGQKRHGVIAAVALQWRTRSGMLASWI
jgi:hypothetical protein